MGCVTYSKELQKVPDCLCRLRLHPVQRGVQRGSAYLRARGTHASRKLPRLPAPALRTALGWCALVSGPVSPKSLGRLDRRGELFSRTMAGAAGPLLTLLLLLLLWPSWAPAEASTQSFEVRVLPEVRGFLDHNATLQCKVHTQEDDLQVTLVTWQRQDATGASRTVAVFHPTQGSSFPESGRLQFVAARPGEKLRDASLVVLGLRAADEANYTCHIATFPQGSKSARTWLRVLAKPQNKAETEEVPLHLLGQELVPVARCMSMAGRPPARISWSSDMKDNKSQEPGTLPGTFNIVSLLILAPSSQVDGTNVSCTVEHETFEKPVLLSVILSVPYPPEVSISGYDDDWYVGRSDAALRCDVRSKPEPTDYVWSTATGPLPPSAIAQGPQLLIHPVDEAINTTFICSATNALGTGKAEQTVLLRGERPKDQSSADNHLFAILIPVLVGLVGLGFLIYFLRSRFSCRNRGSPSENNEVSYSAVNSEASSPQDLQAVSTG
ncbi:poliovirus receptor [Artibeus jamaicensis]|uniref:poliovirus receptor n=1 Tax=Artibeus jamaicensis TaxID=9417 RepID=UPI00235B1AD4|nr:poliovirus receptor [Artibeus jamaicensis]